MDEEFMILGDIIHAYKIVITLFQKQESQLAP